MSGTVSISVIGGDLRQKILAEFLEKDGFSVKTAGFDMEESDSEYDISDLAKSDVVILPLPVSYDNTSVNTPLGKDTIYILQHKKTPKTQGFEGFCDICNSIIIISLRIEEHDERLSNRTSFFPSFLNLLSRNLLVSK